MNRRLVIRTVCGSIRSAFSGAATRVVFFAVLAAFCLSSVLLYAESAGTWYKRGVDAEARQDYDAAFNNYQKACEKDPKDLRYRTAFYRVRVSASSLHMAKGHKLLLAGDNPGALAEFLHADEIDPGNEAAQQEITRMRQKSGEAPTVDYTGLPIAPGKLEEIDSIGAPVELRLLSNEPLTLHMTEDTKVVYQAIGRAAGVNILFDPDYTSKRTQVDLNNVSLTDALRIVGTLSNTFWRPVTANTIFVAANTRAKRTELDEQAVETFYLTNAWQQNDLNDVQTALRNVLPGAKVYGVASQNAIVMRGTPDELLLAQKLVNDLDKARAEVVVDIAILEVSKNWERTLGIAWPQNVGVALQPSGTTSSTTTTDTTGTTSTTASPTLYDLSHLKASDFAVTIGSAQANLLLSDSNTKVIDNPRIRCTDAQKATMKIGERIPIATGSFQSGVGVTAGISPMAETQFQYQDIGVNIEMTPTIHYDHDVTLKIKIEDSTEGPSVTISGVTEPVIIQKTSEQVIRLREGEASVMGGILEKQDMVSWSGVPGLSSIPGLKYLFGSKDHTIQEDEVVFLVVPHIVRTQDLTSVNLRTVDTGEGTSVDLRHVPVEGASPTPALTPAPAPVGAPTPARPAPNPQASVGTVPGVSATEAAPAALAQLKTMSIANGPRAAAPVAAPPQNPAISPAPGAQPSPHITPAPSPQPPGAPVGQTSSAQAAGHTTSPAANPPSGPQAATTPANVPAASAAAATAANAPAAAHPGPQPGSAASSATGPQAAPQSGLPNSHPPRPELNPLTMGNMRLMLNPPQGAVTTGVTFTVPVVLSGGADITSVPLQIQYDPAKLSLVNVASGDFLSRDGQPVALVHRDDGPGSVTINASRPPHSAGVSGAGVVCVLSFQAKAAGETAVTITRPAAVKSAVQQAPSVGTRISIVVK